MAQEGNVARPEERKRAVNLKYLIAGTAGTLPGLLLGLARTAAAIEGPQLTFTNSPAGPSAQWVADTQVVYNHSNRSVVTTS